ncbi:imelysin family protein [Aquimarina hainanensis]|uniref:Imelysin family protein n=1 Tax=Aquimarina hainanensis TaxID=1578017 RepID=A0ABW5NGQ9_9FLAO
MKKITSIFLITLIFFASCNENDHKTTTDTPTNFDNQKMRANIVDDIIIPSVTSFREEATILHEKITLFVAAPSIESLDEAQLQWKKTATAYGYVYAFNIGTVKDNFMHLKLYNWPTYTNAIENRINGNTELNEETIAKISTPSKGISSIEYLLFNSPNNDIIQNFATEKRKQYLSLIAKELQTNAEKLVNIWDRNGDNYATAFIQNKEEGLASSLNLLFNGLYNTADTVKKAKLGKPGGLENSSNTSPENLQAPFSKISKELILANIKSIERTFYNSDGLGVSDKITAIAGDTVLADALQKQLTNTQNALLAIDGDIYTAINTQKEAVSKAHKEITALVIMLSNDVRSILSIIITPTDNDGD